MPQRFLSIKNYEKYQTSSGKKGNRPWIKLYKSILSDPEFMKLSTHSRFLYTGLLLLADDCNNRIYNDRTYIGQRLYIPHTEVNLTPLYRAGFLFASNLSRVLSEEIREEENRGEERVVHPNGKIEFKQSVFLKKEEYDKLVDLFGKEGTDNRLTRLSLYVLSKGDKYKSHYHTILNWERADEEKKLQSKPPKLTGHAGMKTE